MKRGTQIKTMFWQKIALVLFGIFLTLCILEVGMRLGGVYCCLCRNTGTGSQQNIKARIASCVWENPPHLREA